MRPSIKGIAIAARAISVAALCFFLHTSTAAARVMYMVGNISGTINGTAVDFDLNIKMDMTTGEETATVSRMDPEMGAILRQVTAIVTVAGPTGGSTPQGGKNLFELSGGNFVNSATMYWPRTKDKLELIHTVSYAGGDTMRVSATINGTVPIISGHDKVKFEDFTEIMYWGGSDKGTEAARTVTTGVGFKGDFSKAKFRSYKVVKAEGDPVPIDDETGKGSTTIYIGPKSFGPVLRSARDITTTYDQLTGTMNVHLYNTLVPVEADTSTLRGGSPRERREH
jgi:G2F domain-containing protein